MCNNYFRTPRKKAIHRILLSWSSAEISNTPLYACCSAINLTRYESVHQIDLTHCQLSKISRLSTIEKHAGGLLSSLSWVKRPADFAGKGSNSSNVL